MATPAAVSAVVRAHRPQFRAPADKVAFAVHAVCSVTGLRLLAVGPGADTADAATRAGEEEAAIDGWDSASGDAYTLLYALPAAPAAAAPVPANPPAPPPLLIAKAVVVGGQLLASFALDPCPAGREPATVSLDVSRHAGDVTTSYAYGDLDGLVQRVQSALQAATGTGALPNASPSSQQGLTSGAAVKAAQPASRPPAAEQEDDPLRDPSWRPAGPRQVQPPYRVPPYGNPLTVGGDDLLPGGLMPPMPGGVGGGGGFGMGGGMMMGPGHPAFGGGPPRPGFPGGGPGPGIRWDPIAPQGLPGFNPGDFARPGPQRMPGVPPRDIHPDVMQPGPGRGPDWDHMFG